MNNIEREDKDITYGMDLISVIIPTYNRKSYLMEAIDSVLKQNYSNIEILIVDDNSIDGTEELIHDNYKNYDNIYYFKNNINRGPGYNRLKGFNKAKGKYIIFLDDDDYYTDYNFFGDAIKKFNEHSNLSFVSANNYIKKEGKDELIESILNFNNKVTCVEYLNNFQTLKYPKPQSTFTTIFSKKILEDVNLNEVKMVNDTIIYLRALLGGNPEFIKSIVGVYRIHNNNISKACSSDFIIQNLEEKYKIYNLARNISNFRDKITENWLNEQMFLTLDYYISESPTNFKDYIKIIKWINKNIKYKRYLQINNVIKRAIKKYMSR
ncbi:glycosyltransferase family 2 protein [uncultured Clostridium sp.]|uniref:glycosyltransferase family 2 protein n=1 Tax=uncultured Clostridium sp. TaxID=59620 RepID=UPI0025976459|nr:glycosyltransferase [uncultured Clostridium sp.]